MASRHTVAHTDTIPEGTSKVVMVRGKRIALFHIDGQYHAIDDLCPHMGASLATGWVEEGVVTCPLHAWRFRLSDGAWADNPRIKTGCYAVHVEGEQIQLEFPEPDGGDSDVSQ